jgi:hypothetical protein
MTEPVEGKGSRVHAKPGLLLADAESTRPAYVVDGVLRSRTVDALRPHTYRLGSVSH